MATSSNPFNITFGKEPSSIISRENDFIDIYKSFLSDNPDSEIYILTGARGSGKTVSMSTISNDFKERDNWIVIELNPGRDMLEQLASKLYDEGKLKKLFYKAEFNISFKGIGFTLKGDEPILNISTLLKKEFDYLSKKNYRILITIDEVSSDEHMKVFAHEFQLLLRNNYPIFLLMTGLYQNISRIEKEKSLTFLVRAPHIHLSGLNYRSIVNSYKRIFNIDDAEAIKLAKFTNGYAFAYQLLGHILFSQGKKTIDNEVLEKYDELLQERAYDFIYKELTGKEKVILHLASHNNSTTSIVNNTDLTTNMLSNYKKGLYLKGIIQGNYRDTIEFSLPRFKEYLLFIEAINSLS